MKEYNASKKLFLIKILAVILPLHIFFSFFGIFIGMAIWVSITVNLIFVLLSIFFAALFAMFFDKISFQKQGSFTYGKRTIKLEDVKAIEVVLFGQKIVKISISTPKKKYRISNVYPLKEILSNFNSDLVKEKSIRFDLQSPLGLVFMSVGALLFTLLLNLLFLYFRK